MLKKLPNLVTWIHTCPQRVKNLAETITSLDNSDLGTYQICVAGEGDVPYSWPKTVDWWMDRWLEMAGMGDWVLRIEDDVVVSKFVNHNLATWPAIREPDFGIGLGLILDPFIVNTGAIRLLPNMVVQSKAVSFPGGQCQLIPSWAIRKLVPHMRQRMATDPRMPTPSAVWFDTVITQELTNLGLKIYLHVPSLANTTSLSAKSEASNCDRPDHFSHKTWMGDWARPVEYELEFASEELLFDRRTRWAVLGDGSVHRCTTPAKLNPESGPVTINGRMCALRSTCLHNSSQGAYAAAADMVK